MSKTARQTKQIICKSQHSMTCKIKKNRLKPPLKQEGSRQTEEKEDEINGDTSNTRINNRQSN